MGATMSIRVIILTKSKQAIIKDVNAKSGHYKRNDGLYVLATEAIANYSLKGDVKGSEIYFFEGNPNPLSNEGITDNSDTFMNDFILVNALEQTSHSPSLDVNRISEILSSIGNRMKDPSFIMYLLFYSAILYGIISALMEGSLF